MPGLPAGVRAALVSVKHFDAVTRALLVARLRDKRANGAPISADVRRAAATLLVAESTVWCWLTTDTSSSNCSSAASSRSGGDRGSPTKCWFM